MLEGSTVPGVPISGNSSATPCPTNGHRVSDPKIGVRELCPNRVQNRGESSQFLWTRVDWSCPQLGKVSEESNKDARLPDARPRPHNPKVAGSNPAPATKKLTRHGRLARDAFGFSAALR